MTSGREGLFDGCSAAARRAVGDRDWLQAMLDTEAALARALEQAGLAAPGAGAAVTAAARADQFDVAEIGRQAALTGNPVPALVRALSAKLPAGARDAVHRGATSQDIIDTAAMLLAGRAIDAISADLAQRRTRPPSSRARTPARSWPAARCCSRPCRSRSAWSRPAGSPRIDDARRELDRVRATRLAVQFGGAAGTLASLGAAGPAVAALLADELGLAEPVLPWHTDRLRIVQLAAALAGRVRGAGQDSQGRDAARADRGRRGR